jgi:hypothetical protein
MTIKINGWKRIGIIASVVWMIGAGLYTHGALQKSDSKVAVAAALDCMSYIPNGITSLAECDKRREAYNAETYSGEWIGAAVVAFVPVPFGWGFTYLILFLVGWVKRGFSL